MTGYGLSAFCLDGIQSWEGVDPGCRAAVCPLHVLEMAWRIPLCLPYTFGAVAGADVSAVEDDQRLTSPEPTGDAARGRKRGHVAAAAHTGAVARGRGEGEGGSLEALGDLHGDVCVLLHKGAETPPSR